jgi:5-methylcytosine-specific restriction enzyme subunit McrC
MDKLPDHFLLGKPLCEHHQYLHFEDVLEEEDLIFIKSPIYFKNKAKVEFCCFKVDANNRKPITSYFIGTDWLSEENIKAVYIQPKLNKDRSGQTDYLQMLFSLLKHPETLNYVNEIYEIKWDSKAIQINQLQDQLTPLLVVHFLKVVQSIVRKGLKKSYYKVENNLHAKIKGKVLVSLTIKQNLIKNKLLHTWCSYDEFGLNGLENRLLKKALIFVHRYLSSNKSLGKSIIELNSLFNYINSAFECISEEVSLYEVKHIKTNVFYKDYEEGIHLAKLILRRFGYNITNTQQSTVQTPPFWIDMSKLFELYVLGLLKDIFGKGISYHYCTLGNELDFLLNSGNYKMVIDAKYKTSYEKGFKNEDIRQVSGYARLKRVYKLLGKPENEIIDCLIVYPDQLNGNNTLESINLTEKPIEEFVNLYKIPIKLPTH